jgi:hypothetical protein
MQQRTREKLIPVLVGVVVVTIVAVGAMVYAAWPKGTTAKPTGLGSPISALSPSDSPSPSPSEVASPSPSPVASSAKPTPKPTKTSAKPKPKTSLSPKPVTGPTPPKVPVAKPPGSPKPGASCPYLAGPVAARADVQAALVKSAGTAYWDWNITLRTALIEAVGWEESGWQSTIMACDGGTGTMQLMPATADWMNQQCDTNYDIKTLTGNVALGAEYLEWLVHYFGHRYFADDYSLAGDPAKLVLLDVVIAAYQQGFGVIDNVLTNHTDLPNWWYVEAVEGFMVSQPWTAG